MDAIDKIKRYRTLWALVLPHVDVPAPDEVAQWMDYSHEAIEAAIVRAAKKFAKNRIGRNFHPRLAYNYAASAAKIVDWYKAARTTPTQSTEPSTTATP